MKMYQIFILTSLLTIFSSSSYAKTLALDYDDLPHYVRKSNQEILAKKHLVQSRQAQTQHLTRSFLPEVGASGGYETFQTGNLDFQQQPRFQVQGHLNLFRSGKDVLEEKIRQKRVALAQLNLENEYLEQLTLARHLYVQGLYFQNQIQDLKKVISLIHTNQNLIKNKVDAGLISKTSLYEGDILLSQIRSYKILLNEDYEHTLDELKVSLGVDLDSELKLKDHLKHAHADAFHINTSSLPQVEKFKTQAQISNIQRKKHNNWWTPELDAYSNYTLYTYRNREYFDIDNRDEFVAGISLNIPLFDKLESATASKVEKFRAKAFQAQAKQKNEEFKALVKKLQHGIKVRHQLIHQSLQTLNLAQTYLFKSREEFATGVKDSSAMLSAIQTLWEEHQRQNLYLKEYHMLEANLSALAENN